MSDTLILFDLETSGLLSYKHEIIQIAAAVYSLTTGTILDTFERKLEFDIYKAEPRALEVTRWSQEAWASAVPAITAYEDFNAFIAPHKNVRMYSEKKKKEYYVAQLAGFNAATFDGPFLTKAFRDNQLFLSASPKILDVMQLAMWILRLRNIRLENDRQETICKHFGITYDAHEALADVRAMAGLLNKLTGREELNESNG